MRLVQYPDAMGRRRQVISALITLPNLSNDSTTPTNSLDDFISARQGSSSTTSDDVDDSGDLHSRADRIRAFRSRQQDGRRLGKNLKAIHLLSLDEVRGLFGDIVAGLAFLVRAPSYVDSQGGTYTGVYGSTIILSCTWISNPGTCF